ncbi:MAG: aldehyde dehydrogenase family protein, partial [Nitrospirales bacterium]
RHYVELGKKDGICLLDRQVMGLGYFQGPVILTNLPPSHPVVQEEIFGPVMVVFQVPTIHEAFTLANDSPFALTGGIYSRSPANLQLARELFEVGNLYINRPITGSLVGRQPFGGHRLSGIGKKAGGQGYLEQFMVEKIITEIPSVGDLLLPHKTHLRASALFSVGSSCPQNSATYQNEMLDLRRCGSIPKTHNKTSHLDVIKP